MSTENDHDDAGDIDSDDITKVRAALKREQKRRKDAEAAAQEGSTARRELTFLRAGVDLDSAVGKLFAKAYDGELDPEAIKTQWSEIAPSGATPPASAETTTEPPAATGEPPSGLSDAEAAELAARRAALTSNTSPPGEEPSSPLGQAMMDAAFHAQGGARARPGGGMSPKARDAAFDVLFERAAAGDPAAVFKKPTEHWADATDRWRASQ